MKIGALIGLMIIYIVLAWIFKSWLRPVSIMIMIPLCFIGAVFGHYFLNLTMSILSMFALLALAGIVVNNSIILVATIERRFEELGSTNDNYSTVFQNAVISGVTNRLRPVVLTSLTTMGGLTTLMFEKIIASSVFNTYGCYNCFWIRCNRCFSSYCSTFYDGHWSRFFKYYKKNKID